MKRSANEMADVPTACREKAWSTRVMKGWCEKRNAQLDSLHDACVIAAG